MNFDAKQRNAPRRNPRFGLATWNVFDRTINGLPPTSNNVEGWHHAFSGLAKNHPHTLKLINAIKTEQSNTQNVITRAQAGHVHGRATKWIRHEEQVNEIVKGYSKDNVMEYLENLALIVQFTSK